MIDTILDIFPNLKNYIELIPIALVGVIVGIVKYLQNEAEIYTKKQIIRDFITSTFLCVITYAMLSAADLPYLAKMGVASAIAYFGIERALEIVKQIINLKGSKESKNEYL